MNEFDLNVFSFKMLSVCAYDMCMCCWKHNKRFSEPTQTLLSVTISLPYIHTLQPPSPFLCSERTSVTPQGPLGPLRFWGGAAQCLCPVNGVSTAPFIAPSIVMLSLIKPLSDGGRWSLYNMYHSDITCPSCALFLHRGES